MPESIVPPGEPRYCRMCCGKMHPSTTPAGESVLECAVCGHAVMLATVAESTYSWRQAIGRRGGLATRDKYGSDFYHRIGQIGFYETCRRYWGGDRAAFCAHLRERGLLKTADREIGLMLDLYRQHRPELLESEK